MKIQSIRKGSNPSLQVRLYDGDSDSSLPLAGYTGWGATAKHSVSGAVVAFDSVVVTDSTNGVVKIDYADTKFTAVGVYDIDIYAHDPTGRYVIYPYERGTLKMKVDEAN